MSEVHPMAELAARRAPVRKFFALGPKSRAKWSPEEDASVVVTYRGASLDLREAMEADLKVTGVPSSTTVTRVWRELVVQVDGLVDFDGQPYALEFEGGHLTDDSLAALPSKMRNDFWANVLRLSNLSPEEKRDLG